MRPLIRQAESLSEHPSTLNCEALNGASTMRTVTPLRSWNVAVVSADAVAGTNRLNRAKRIPTDEVLVDVRAPSRSAVFRYGQHISAVERVFTRHNPLVIPSPGDCLGS